MHREKSAVWVERCHTQIGAVLDALEHAYVARPAQPWFDEKLGHADIAVWLRLPPAVNPRVIGGRVVEAVAIAKQCPGLPYGATVEVRPVMDHCPVSGQAVPEVQFAEATA